jgi:hypothetical protein
MTSVSQKMTLSREPILMTYLETFHGLLTNVGLGWISLMVLF